MSNSERFEKLRSAVREAADGITEIVIGVVTRAGTPRIRIERRLSGGSSRYMEVNYVSPDPGQFHSYDRYACRFGVYGHANQAMNFDSRQWGDLPHMALLIRKFMVDLASEDTIKLFVPPIPPDKG